MWRFQRQAPGRTVCHQRAGLTDGPSLVASGRPEDDLVVRRPDRMEVDRRVECEPRRDLSGQIDDPQILRPDISAVATRKMCFNRDQVALGRCLGQDLLPLALPAR